MIKYHSARGIVIHKAHITQLSWSVYIHLTGDYQLLIRDILIMDDGLRAIDLAQNPSQDLTIDPE